MALGSCGLLSSPVLFTYWDWFMYKQHIASIVNTDINWNTFEHNVFLKLLYHLFYINNAANPIIYTFFSNQFKVDVHNFLKKRKICRR